LYYNKLVPHIASRQEAPV